MLLEVVAALFLGLLVLWMILEPLYRPAVAAPAWEEPEDPEETRRGIALIALKEIDFDRATGKLSDTDYEVLKARYAREALDALEEEGHSPAAAGSTDDAIERLIAGRVAELDAAPGHADAGSPICPNCGPRPEPDALFCSSCGARLRALAACEACRTPLEPGSRYCGNCGSPVDPEQSGASSPSAPSV